MNLQDFSNVTCDFVSHVPDSLKCYFVKQATDCDEGDFFQSYYLLYCLMNNSAFAPFVLLLFVLLLFVVVGVIADDFICPLMAALATMLRLSESVAGVTILALANGTPDMMSAFNSLQQEAPETMFCSLVGGGLIDCTLVVGIIIFMERVRFQPVAIIRDCGFYLFSMCMFCLFYYKEVWTLYNSVFFIVVYLIYALVVLARYFYDLKLSTKEEEKEPTNMEDLIIKRVSYSRNVQEDKHYIHKELGTLVKDLWVLVKPDKEELKGKNLCSKILFLGILMPISSILKLLLPQFNFTIERNGWSKSLYMINVLVFPLLTVFCFNYEAVPVYIIETITMGLLFSATVYITTSRVQKPRYHNLIIAHVFFTTFSLINILVNSIISLLRAMASRFAFSSSSLPLTLLALGNCIGDFVTNVNLARSGLPRMAIAACYAGPLFNLVFDSGFVTAYVFLSNEQTSMTVSSGEMGPIGILFLLLVLAITIVIIPLIYFEARKSFAIFLFILYIQFILLIALSELGIVYPLGDSDTNRQHKTEATLRRDCDVIYEFC